MEAAAALLLQDDTARAATLLVRLRESGDPAFVASAGAMLKQLEPIEPAVKAPASDAAHFFLDAGPAEPVHISKLVPPVDRAQMEVLARPLPKLIQDQEPVVLLASLSADAEASQTVALPALAEPALTGENLWREIEAARQRSATSAETTPPARSTETVDLAHESKKTRLLQVASDPAGALVLVGDRVEAVCQTPCDIRVEPGTYTVRLSLTGYKNEEREVRITTRKAEVLEVSLSVLRGIVIVETPTAAALKVNGAATGVSAPAELALVPGLHVITADFGATSRQRTLTVKPGARLRVQLKP